MAISSLIFMMKRVMIKIMVLMTIMMMVAMLINNGTMAMLRIMVILVFTEGAVVGIVGDNRACWSCFSL